MPEEVQDAIGYALTVAQYAIRWESTQCGPYAGIWWSYRTEIKDDDDGNTYRLAYTVRFPNVVYALHAWQKKSRHGIATDPADIELIRSTLAAAEEDYGKPAR